MNYIHHLQAGFTQAHDKIAAIESEILAFRVHLGGDKFCGYEPDGSRKDWIATADVHRWLDRIASAALPGEADGAPAPPDQR